MRPRTLPIALVSLAVTLACPLSVAAATTRIRLMAANLTSGNDQAYHDPGIRIFQGLHPDVVMIQEFNVGGNTAPEIDAFVDAAFGTEFSWFREPGGEQIPNGVISRYPIISSGQWDDTLVSNRDFAWARIDVPGNRDLWAVSVHLLTASSTDRNAEASLLVSNIGAGVPAGDYLVIGGDLNTGSRTESAIATLSGVVVTGAPYPADQNGNSNTNEPRSEAYDWVLPDADLNAFKTSLLIGASVYSNGLVFDSRVYTPLSEVAPVLVGDSGVSGMQHMAVARDFLIPTDGGDTTPPAPPTGLTATPGDGQVALDWADNAEPDLSGYNVYRALTSGGPYAQVNTVRVAPSAHTDTGLTNGTPYFYVVTAVDTSSNESAQSSEASATPTSGGSVTGQPWINELHYDNVNTDTGEFVEVAGPAGTDLTGWTLVGYNGADGAMYQTVNLSGVLPSQMNGFGTLGFAFAGLQNGAPDGIALVDATDAVVQFLSYEGTFTANGGPASGMTSTDIGVSETNETPVGESLQLTNSGSKYSDFTWQEPLPNTEGLPNIGQTFVPETPPAPVGLSLR
jgi:endonuclease/exonuclease/phosphatase family metal-dependent hydrolase